VRVLIVITALLFAGSWWLSEDLFFPIEQLRAVKLDNRAGLLIAGAVVLIVLAAIGSTIVWRSRWPWRVFGAALVISGTLTGGYLGHRCASSALNECAGSPDRVPRALAAYHQRMGQFPMTLEQLGVVPCKRCLRGSIVTYKSDGVTYDFSFGDWLVTWHGTDREPITAIK